MQFVGENMSPSLNLIKASLLRGLKTFERSVTPMKRGWLNGNNDASNYYIKFFLMHQWNAQMKCGFEP